MRHDVTPWLALSLALALCGTGAGCGESDGLGAHVPVSGKITLDGQPLKTGHIVFSPLEVGRGAQASIVDGAYTVPKSRGPSPGPYRVEIHSIQPTGKKVFDRGEGEMIEETKNLVPAMYNANTTLQAEVKAGGENTFPFDLKTTSRAQAH